MKFEYLEAHSPEEAVSLLETHNGRAKVIAGGTDLVVQMRRRTIKPECVINIGKIKELDYINYDKENGLKIGTLAKISSLEKAEKVRQYYAVISKAARDKIRRTGAT